jgi:hypothetical protein
MSHSKYSAEVWKHFAHEDERILPFDMYEAIDKRPWEPYGRIDFRLNQDQVPDTTENGCSSSGGDGPLWILPKIDPVRPGHEHGKLLAERSVSRWRIFRN